MTGRLFDDLGAADVLRHLITVTLMAEGATLTDSQVAQDPALSKTQAKQRHAVQGMKRVLIQHGWVEPVLVTAESQDGADDACAAKDADE